MNKLLVHDNLRLSNILIKKYKIEFMESNNAQI